MNTKLNAEPLSVSAKALFKLPVVAGLALTLAACMPMVGPTVKSDSAPIVPVVAERIPDAIPRVDKITRAGNKNPYTVLGKTYRLLPTSKGYIETGIASWYGTKFQGRPTANGEKYNLYAMTAAHKTLPIPAYVKVTNLDNQRSVVVRVNDRGPFHSDRIIDLSYAAAVKLGYAEKGTARVKVTAIDPTAGRAAAAISAAAEQYFLQVGAFKDLQRATQLRSDLQLAIKHPVSIRPSEPAGFYRVQIGPLNDLDLIKGISEQLLAMNMGSPRLITQ